METGLLNSYGDHNRRFKSVVVHADAFSSEASSSTHPSPDNKYSSHEANSESGEDYSRTLNDWRSHVASFPMTDDGEDEHNQLFGCMQDYQDSEHKFQGDNNVHQQESDTEKAAQQISEEFQQNDQPTDNANEAENLIEEGEEEEYSDCEEYIYNELSPDDYDIEIEYPENEWEEMEDGDDGGPIIHIFAVDPELDSCCSSSDEETDRMHINGDAKSESELDFEVNEPQSDWAIPQEENVTDMVETKKDVGYIESEEQTIQHIENVQSEAEDNDKSDSGSSASSRSSSSSSSSCSSSDSDSDSDVGDEVIENKVSSHHVGEHGYSMLPENIFSPCSEAGDVHEDFNQIQSDHFDERNKDCSHEVPSNFIVSHSAPVVESLDVQDIEKEQSNLKDELPHVEDLKKFLFEEISNVNLRGTVSRNINKSLSLPQSPFNDTHVVDERTCISFDDLNLSDFTDFNFDVDLKGDISGELDKNVDEDIGLETAETDEISEVRLTDVCQNDESKDNLSEEEMELDEPVSHEDIVLEGNNDIVTKSSPQNTSLLEFCIERPKINTCLEDVTSKFNYGNSNIRTIASEQKTDEDFVDVESFSDNISIPVLQANNLNTLLEQFEESEKVNKIVAKNTQNENELDCVEQENTPQKWNKVNGLVNGNRIQDAAAQWNKNKIRKILMSPGSSSSNLNINSSTESVQSDHDYCSPVKKQNGKQPDVIQYNTRYKQASQQNKNSLLKPDLLTNIDNCQSVNLLPEDQNKNKQTNNCDNLSARNINNNKLTVIQINSDKGNSPESVAINSNHRKKHSVDISGNIKNKSDTIESTSDKCSNNDSSNNNRGRIKLTIKNKSKVILNIDSKKAHKVDSVNNKFKDASFLKDVSSESCKVRNDKKQMSTNKVIQRSSTRSLLKVIKTEDVKSEKRISTKYSSPKPENVVFTPPKKEVAKSPMLSISEEDVNPIIDQLNKNIDEICDDIENIEGSTQKTGPVKKKLKLQDYMKRREVQSSDTPGVASPMSTVWSTNSSPAAGMHYDIVPINFEKANSVQSSPSNKSNSLETKDLLRQENELKTTDTQVENKKIYDPIMEATRKVLQKQNNMKTKAEALRKKEEDIVMSQIPKVQSLELKPLISESEMLKYTNNVNELAKQVLPNSSTPDPRETPERLKNSEYEEIVMVSVGVNTEPIEAEIRHASAERRKSNVDEEETIDKQSEGKHGINFKIRKSENVMKRNVFENSQNKSKSSIPSKGKVESHVKRDNSRRTNNDNSHRSHDKSQQADGKCSIDEVRYKTITATLKKVERSDVKITSNSLFASIQDVVKKSGPQANEEVQDKNKSDKRHSKERQIVNKPAKHDHRNKNEPAKQQAKFTIVRETNSAEHGEDKIILHLRKDRIKVAVQIAEIQTDTDKQFAALIDTLRDEMKSPSIEPKIINNNCQTLTQTKLMKMANGNPRKRNDSDMSMSSDGRVSRASNHSRESYHSLYGHQRESRNGKRRSRSPKQPFSRDRYQSKVRGRSRIRSVSRDRSRSRDRARSRERYSTKNYNRNNLYRKRSRSRSLRRNERYRSRSPNRYRHNRDKRSPSYRRERYRNSYGRGRSNSRSRRQDRSTSRHYKRKRSASVSKQRSSVGKILKSKKTPEVKSPIRRYTPELTNSNLVEGKTPDKTPPIKRIKTPLIEEGTPIRKETSPVADSIRKRKESLRERRVSRGKSCSSNSESSSSSYSSSSSDDSSSDSEDSVHASSRGPSRSPSHSSHLSRSPSLEPNRRADEERPLYRRMGNKNMGYGRASDDDGTPVEERRIVFVGKLEAELSKQQLRNLFSKFGPISEVTTHTKDNGARYGFVTMVHAHDAWTAVESANTSRAPALQHYDVGFGGRRAFCRQRYADLDGMEAEYSESGYLSQPSSGGEDLSFDLLLQQMKNKLNQKKGTV